MGGNYRNTNCIYQGVFHLSCSNHFRKAEAGATWGHDTGVRVLCSTEALERHRLPAELFLPGSPISPLLPRKWIRTSCGRVLLAKPSQSWVAPLIKSEYQGTLLCVRQEGMKHKVKVWLTQIQTARQRHEQSWNRVPSSLISQCGCRQTALPLNCVFQCIITCLLAG